MLGVTRDKQRCMYVVRGQRFSNIELEVQVSLSCDVERIVCVPGRFVDSAVVVTALTLYLGPGELVDRRLGYSRLCGEAEFLRLLPRWLISCRCLPLFYFLLIFTRQNNCFFKVLWPLQRSCSGIDLSSNFFLLDAFLCGVYWCARCREFEFMYRLCSYALNRSKPRFPGV